MKLFIEYKPPFKVDHISLYNHEINDKQGYFICGGMTVEVAIMVCEALNKAAKAQKKGKKI